VIGAIITLSLLLVGSLFIIFRRGRKVDYNPEDYVPDLVLNEEEEAETLEAVYEALEITKGEDEDFDNKVQKISEEFDEASADDVANYVNQFFLGRDSENNAIVPTSEAKFDWEGDSSTK
jgi:cbb3-type cytochrome oxidase subunit 3